MRTQATRRRRWLVFVALIAATVIATASALGNVTAVHAALVAQPTPPESWIVPGRKYHFPVQPPSLARYGRVHHDYPATDIFVPVGSVVVAVTSGVVDEVSRVDLWNARTNDGAYRGGLWVTIIGDDSVRYHTSHLSKVLDGIEPGVRVAAGQRIGLSGKTGNAATTPAHVHFGISRPTTAGDWMVRRGQVSPYAYLQAWKRGKDTMPILPKG